MPSGILRLKRFDPVERGECESRWPDYEPLEDRIARHDAEHRRRTIDARRPRATLRLKRATGEVLATLHPSKETGA